MSPYPAACRQLSQLCAASELSQWACCWPVQALFRPAQLKALVDIHAAEEGLPEGYLSTGVSDLPCVISAQYANKQNALRFTTARGALRNDDTCADWANFWVTS
jgi:hypothetical protein